MSEPAYVARALERYRWPVSRRQRRPGSDVNLRLTPDEARLLSLRLLKAMSRTGDTSATLGRRAGCDPRAVAYYLNATLGPRARVLERLARALGCSPDWLAGCSDEPQFCDPVDQPRPSRERQQRRPAPPDPIDPIVDAAAERFALRGAA